MQHGIAGWYIVNFFNANLELGDFTLMAESGFTITPYRLWGFSINHSVLNNEYKTYSETEINRLFLRKDFNLDI